MAFWKECPECISGVVECPVCSGDGFEGDDEEPCDYCVGEGGDPCDACEGEGGWYTEGEDDDGV